MSDVIWEKYAPNPSKMDVSNQFQAKRAKYKNHNIFETINPTKTEFKDQP